MVLAVLGVSGFTYRVRSIDQLDLAKAQVELIDSKRTLGDLTPDNTTGLAGTKGMGLV